MGHNFGNNYSDGHNAQVYKYEPSWEKMVDYNPDHRHASSGRWVDERDGVVYELLAVPGYGAFLLRAVQDENGRCEFKGVSSFADDEIGWRT